MARHGFSPTSITEEALAPILMEEKFPSKWVWSKFPEFKGLIDPKDHIHICIKYRRLTHQHDLWCRLF